MSKKTVTVTVAITEGDGAITEIAIDDWYATPRGLDEDHGRVVAISAEGITIAWEGSMQRTTQPAEALNGGTLYIHNPYPRAT